MLGKFSFKSLRKNFGRNMLAVATGGASLAFKKARPSSPFVKAAPRVTPKPTVVNTNFMRPTVQPNSAAPVRVVNTNLIRPTVQPNSVVRQSPASPIRPLRVVQKAKAPAPIVGYNPNTKKVVRAKPNRSKGQGINISINVNSQNAPRPQAPRPQAMRSTNGKRVVKNNPLRKI